MLVEKGPESCLAEECKENTIILGHLCKRVLHLLLYFCILLSVAWDGLKDDMPDEGRVKSYSEFFDGTLLNGQFKLCLWNYYAHVGPRTKTTWRVGMTD